MPIRARNAAAVLPAALVDPSASTAAVWHDARRLAAGAAARCRVPASGVGAASAQGSGKIRWLQTWPVLVTKFPKALPLIAL